MTVAAEAPRWQPADGGVRLRYLPHVAAVEAYVLREGQPPRALLAIIWRWPGRRHDWRLRALHRGAFSEDLGEEYPTREEAEVAWVQHDAIVRLGGVAR